MTSYSLVRNFSAATYLLRLRFFRISSISSRYFVYLNIDGLLESAFVAYVSRLISYSCEKPEIVDALSRGLSLALGALST